MLRCLFSLERMLRVTEQGRAIYLAEKKACRRFPKPANGDLFSGVAHRFQVFDTLDFIAELTQQIPDPRPAEPAWSPDGSTPLISRTTSAVRPLGVVCRCLADSSWRLGKFAVDAGGPSTTLFC